MSGDTALVVGGGFIGGHLARALLDAGRPTRVLTRSPLSKDERERLHGAEMVTGDASIRPVVEGALESVDHLFFCAGGLMPAESNLDPAIDAALALPPLINVLEAIRRRPEIPVTFLSSGGTIYGDPAVLPVTEDAPPSPFTSYGVMKLASEKYLLMYQRLYGLQVRILRPSNVYGEHQPTGRGLGLIATILERLLAGESITVFGDGLNERDFVYIGDLVAAMTQLAQTDAGPAVLNVGSGQATTLLDVIAAVEAVTGRRVPIDHQPDRGFDVRSIVLDISALRSTIAFEPTPLEPGIAAAWAAMTAT